MKFKFVLIASMMLWAGSAFAQSGVADPPRGLYMTPTGVNLPDLGYSYSQVDLSIGTLSLERNYASQGFSSASFMGFSWTHSYDMWSGSYVLHGNAESKVIIGRRIYKYLGAPSTSPSIPQLDEGGTSFTLVAGVPTFTDQDSTVYTFGLSQYGSPDRITAVSTPDGEQKTFTYLSGKLKYVSTNRGYAIVFDYSGNLLVAACAFDLAQTFVSTSTTCSGAAMKVTYSYTNSRLVSSTDIQGHVTTYNYINSTSAYLTCVTDPDSSSCKVTNTYGPKNGGNVYGVVQQTLADGSVWTYDCSCGASHMGDPDDPYAVEWTDVTQPGGAVSSTWFMMDAPYRQWDASGALYEWVYSGRFPFSVKEPEGNQTIWNYTPHGLPAGRTLKPKTGSSAPDINIDAATFPTSCTVRVLCDKPLTVADPRGNVTNYTYDSTHGGVLSAMQPAPSISPASARPLTLYTYAQKYAYVKNSGGSLVAAATPVWVPNAMTECQTVVGSSTAACDSSAPQVVTTYLYGANGTADNLLLRGMVVSDGTTSFRTCYTYDDWGRKISETQPRAGLSSC